MNKKIRGNAITNKINNKYIIAAILVLVIVLVKTLVIKDSQKSSVSHIKRPEQIHMLSQEKCQRKRHSNALMKPMMSC